MSIRAQLSGPLLRASHKAVDERNAIVVPPTTSQKEPPVLVATVSSQCLLNTRQACITGGLIVVADALFAGTAAAIAHALHADRAEVLDALGMLLLAGNRTRLANQHRVGTRGEPHGGKPDGEQRHGAGEAEPGARVHRLARRSTSMGWTRSLTVQAKPTYRRADPTPRRIIHHDTSSWPGHGTHFAGASRAMNRMVSHERHPGEGMNLLSRARCPLHTGNWSSPVEIAACGACARLSPFCHLDQRGRLPGQFPVCTAVSCSRAGRYLVARWGATELRCMTDEPAPPSAAAVGHCAIRRATATPRPERAAHRAGTS